MPLHVVLVFHILRCVETPFLIGAGNLDHLEGEIGHQKTNGSTPHSLATRSLVNLTMEFCGLMTVLWALAAPALRTEQVLETGFQSQRTETADTLLQGKTVKPLPIAEGREAERVKCNLCRTTFIIIWWPEFSQSDLDVWSGNYLFLFACFLLGYNEQELFYGDTLRINGKERNIY